MRCRPDTSEHLSKEHRKSAEHEDWAQGNSGGGLERTGENVEEPTGTGKEVSASSDAPTAATSVHKYKLAAPDGRTWLFGDEVQETTLRDRVGNGFVLFCNCSSGLVTTYGPITAGGEAEELGTWFNESGPGLHRAPTSRSPTVSTSDATKKGFLLRTPGNASRRRQDGSVRTALRRAYRRAISLGEAEARRYG